MTKKKEPRIISMGATINIGDYNSVKVEYAGDERDALHKVIADEFAHYDNKTFAKYHSALSTGGGEWEKIRTICEEDILYNDTTHIYKDTKEQILLGGSTYAGAMTGGFNMEQALKRKAESLKTDEASVSLNWTNAADVGTAVHGAIEAAIKSKGKVVPHPVVSTAVKSFESMYGLEFMSEVFVSKLDSRCTGQVDLLQPTGDKSYRMLDIKTNTRLDKKKLLKFAHQMSFYAWCMEAAGLVVDSIAALHYDGVVWTEHVLERQDIDEQVIKKLLIG